MGQIAAVLAIGLGWSERGEHWLVPDRGVGFALGFVGLGAMVLLLAYPLRKHWRALRHAGRIGVWFRIHMLLGLFGPVAVLYHANFTLGSTNANVALVCALVVAASGVVGRVLYVRIHGGLEGRRRTLDEVREGALSSERALASSTASEAVVARLRAFERSLLDPAVPAVRRVTRGLTSGFAGRRALRDVRRLVRVDAPRAPDGRRAEQSLLDAARQFVAAVRSVALFRTWDRLFSLWHVAHLPLSFLLYLTAAIHVIAVYAY